MTARGQEGGARQATRLARAIALLAAVFFAVALLGGAFSAIESALSGAQSAASACLSGPSYEEEGDAGVPNGALWLEEEGLLPADARDVKANEDGSVVGFRVSGERAQVFEEMARNLVDAGWAMAETGMEGAAVFARPEGYHAWMLLSCVGVSGWVCVTVQSPFVG